MCSGSAPAFPIVPTHRRHWRADPPWQPEMEPEAILLEAVHCVITRRGGKLKCEHEHHCFDAKTNDWPQCPSGLCPLQTGQWHPQVTLSSSESPLAAVSSAPLLGLCSSQSGTSSDTASGLWMLPDFREREKTKHFLGELNMAWVFGMNYRWTNLNYKQIPHHLSCRVRYYLALEKFDPCLLQHYPGKVALLSTWSAKVQRIVLFSVSL